MSELAEIRESAAAWIGREERARDEVSLVLAQRLAATFDLSGDGLRRGAPLPDGWHIMLFGPLAETSTLNRDGHPKTGDFLPALPLPRRMFAARRVIFHQPLEIGETATRVARIAAIEPKQGRSGPLAFVKVVNEISGARGLAVTEEQQIVYRADVASGAPRKSPSSGELPEGDFEWRRDYTPDAAMLFRYSSVMFNGHRIHYDADYTRDVEGYPDRVVNGGLTAFMLLTFAKQVGERRLRAFSVRNLRPLFVDRPVALRGRPTEENHGEFLALDADGFVSVRGAFEWEPK